jgi:hypothetical protein
VPSRPPYAEQQLQKLNYKAAAQGGSAEGIIPCVRRAGYAFG